MFRLLIFFVILIFVGLLSYCIYKLIKDGMKKETPKDPKTNIPIDIMIAELKSAIKESELEAEAGAISATARLAYYKDELRKLETIKNKTKNL